MTTATKQQSASNPTSNGRGYFPGKLTRFKSPTGTGWVDRIARGLTVFRELQGLTIPKAAVKYGIEQTIWYRFERGQHPATTVLNIDSICEAIDKDPTYLYVVGKNLRA